MDGHYSKLPPSPGYVAIPQMLLNLPHPPLPLSLVRSPQMDTNSGIIIVVIVFAEKANFEAANYPQKTSSIACQDVNYKTSHLLSKRTSLAAYN